MQDPRCTGRERLDALLVLRGLAPNRSKAQTLVLAGQVATRGRPLDKPGQRLPLDSPLELREPPRFVSRGGWKLAAALEHFQIAAGERDALDVGASTGGFTHALLQAGARRVIALDVGRGQLDWTLRRDPRVVPLEGVNARYLEASALPFVPSLGVVDVAFISLKLVLPPLVSCTSPDGEVVALVKPQFEVGRGSVGRGGIVRERALHARVLEQLGRFVRDRGWGLCGLCRSALCGAEGNQEFFMHLRPLAPAMHDEALLRQIQSVLQSEGEAGP